MPARPDWRRRAGVDKTRSMPTTLTLFTDFV